MEPTTKPSVVSLLAPNGHPIQGTAETISGIAVASTAIVNADGTIEPEWSGWTDVNWNSQRTDLTESGKRLYVDDVGLLWPEDELILKPHTEQN